MPEAGPGDGSVPDEGSGQGDGSGRGDGAPAAAPLRRRHRRVTTDPPPGSDPAPIEEPDRHDPGENDERMRGDKPPHY